jgi:hypothetical protein
MLDNIHKNFMRELLNPEPEQEDLFSKALARVQESLTNNTPYKKLGKL